MKKPTEIYRYNGQSYRKVDEIFVRNAADTEWEVHVLYKDNIGNQYARPSAFFYTEFRHIGNIIDMQSLYASLNSTSKAGIAN